MLQNVWTPLIYAIQQRPSSLLYHFETIFFLRIQAMPFITQHDYSSVHETFLGGPGDPVTLRPSDLRVFIF